MLSETLALVLTGITTSIIGGFIYYSGNKGIQSGGTYTSKNDAVFLLILKTAFIGGITPIIHGLYLSIASAVNLFLVLGVILIIGTFAINEEVANFRHDTETSLVLYGAGLILFFIGL